MARTIGEIGGSPTERLPSQRLDIERRKYDSGLVSALVARKFDGSRPCYPGRPRVEPEMEELVVRFARENSSWGYDRIVGALANLGHQISDQTVGNILRRHDIAPAPERSRTTTWKEFIRSHMDVLAGADFFTVEVLTWRGLMTYYVLFFIELDSRRVWLGGITRHPDACWMEQVARNATMEGTGYLNGCRYLLHDRDKKFCRSSGKHLRRVVWSARRYQREVRI